jgi:CRISPR-associated Csx11 family protein
MLDKLKENRVPILLTEIGAYLHLIGRFSDDFIRANAEDATDAEKSFRYQNVCKNRDFFENTGLYELLSDNSWEALINNFNELNNAEELSRNKVKNFCEFIEKHVWKGNGPRGLCRILADAHGITSGIDKGLAGKGETGRQRKNYTFRATAFGWEREIELLGSVNLSNVEKERIKEVKKILFREIKKILKNVMISKDISYNDYKVFIELIKQYYSKTIGETRRPINEISLYDYAYIIASLVKSNLAKMVIDGWEPKGKSKWRILRINIDVLGLLSKGLKIGDILGYKNELDEVYEEIKKIIEFEYALGNEIYRDSTGIYFSCPDVSNIDKLKSEIIEKLKSLNKLDFSLQIEISESSRSMVVLAKEIKNSLKEIFYHHISDLENLKKEFEESQSTEGEDICPICGIRLKPEGEDRCKKCRDRYEKRTRIWLDEGKALEETIWLDEIADKNDLIALIVGQFDLRKWLSSEFINTFISQTFDEWKNSKEVSDICNILNIKNISNLEIGFLNLFNNPRSLDSNWKKICSSFVGVEPGDFIKDFWEPIAERDSTGRASAPASNPEKAKYLIKLLFRKHPSPARIFRIWKTTQEFINEIIFEKILKKYDWGPELRKQRIQLKIEPNPDVPYGLTCDIDVDGVRFSPVRIDRQNGIFISTINLEILKKFGNSADIISKKLNGKIIKVKTEKDKTWKSKKGGQTFKITEARPADGRYNNYLPYVKIYDFPDQFMILVPAYEALDIATRILNEYEIQFSKVRDRLPFHLGIIAFHRKTPLYVVMDAGRRLLEAYNQKTQTLDAEVTGVRDNKDEKNIELEIKAETYTSRTFKWKISYSTGDPEKEDLWHPYVRFKGDNSSRILSFDYTGNGDFVVHIKEIHKGDVIKIEPSYFTLYYLENVTDRFNVGDTLIALHDINLLQGLWKEIENRLKSGMSTSQIYTYWDEVKRRRKSYDSPTFEKFVKAALVNILKIKPQDGSLFDLFFQSTIDCSLDLCLYWNFQVRKIKVREGGGI